MSSLSFVEQLQVGRVRRHARAFVRRAATSGAPAAPEARKLLRNDEAFAEFVEAAIVEQSQLMGGPLMDILQALIQDFIDNPEKWIALIIKIIGLF